MVLTDAQIVQAKKDAGQIQPRHEHNDCIRMAYEWLDVQRTTKGKRSADWKHIIERWCGRYISDDDVRIAAFMNPKIDGKYPNYNIGKQLTLPSSQRLRAIGEAGKHNQILRVGRPNVYKFIESDI
ncbi:hypothetical protein [Paracoccus marcusii]|uniref:hypothetical protein n=1 Tax=Paracoccus marcusii TaxID=59779 RepID=UPI003736EF0C